MFSFSKSLSFKFTSTLFSFKACVFVVLNSILFPFEVLEVPLLVYLKGKLDLEGAAFADARNLIVLGPLVSGELVSL
jgi:hypothetical protein